MASSNFDELTKALAASTSRRQTIRVLFASALGGMLGFGGMGIPQAEGWKGVGASSDNCTTGGVCGATNDDVSIWQKIHKCVNASDCGNAVGHDTHWVLYKEPKNPTTNYTLFAGERRKGIECPKIWEHTNPNYWQFALDAANRVGHPDKIGLAINSATTRTQCQLHIHVSCIQPDVQRQLDRSFNDKSKIVRDPKNWKKPILSLDYQVGSNTRTNNFRVLWLKLDPKNFLSNGQNLFQLLRDNIVKNDSDMQNQTLVVTPSPKYTGFYILNSSSNMSDLSNGNGHGEVLLDETCAMK